MRVHGEQTTRLLALDPHARGWGFVVLEEPDILVDWGVKSAARTDPNETALIQRLIQWYRPHAVIVEDVDDPSCRRGDRAKTLVRVAAGLANSSSAAVCRYSRMTVQKVFEQSGARNKAQIAAAVALRLPVLIRHLPPVRKPWMSEDARFAIFDAAAFALVYLHQKSTEPFGF